MTEKSLTLPIRYGIISRNKQESARFYCMEHVMRLNPKSGQIVMIFPADKRCLNDTNADAGWQNGDEHE